ncbi:MAG: hypothetical protein FD126_505 [Elusimicrobia bacterium]|nr:MAG: hypothetical protein FD126_505 [Elusimicrobiota bacterium]
MTRTLNLAATALLLAALPAQANYGKLFDGGFGEFKPGNLPSIIPSIGEGQEVGAQAAGADAGGVEALARRLQQSNPEIPAAALQKLFKYLKANPAHNSNYATIIDMDKPSDQKRMYVINLRTGQVDKYLVAHGAGSGRGDTAEDFSDKPRSHQTSLGIYITGSEYDGKHGRSLKLDGQENSNDNAESRSVVLHGADYVSDEYARQNGRVGNSWGCPAVDHKYRDEIIDKIGNGSVMLIYAT